MDLIVLLVLLCPLILLGPKLLKHGCNTTNTISTVTNDGTTKPLVLNSVT